MTNSGLIVFLPLIGAILGGIVGAWANSWYRNREAKKAENQERRALLVLLDTEVRINTVGLHGVFEGLTKTEDVRLRTTVWDQVQVRLAHLIRYEHLKDLTIYYETLAKLEPLLLRSNNLAKADFIMDRVEDGYKITQLMQEYIADPDYVDLQSVLQKYRPKS